MYHSNLNNENYLSCVLNNLFDDINIRLVSF